MTLTPALTIGSVVVLVGCYQYVPTTVEQVPVGADVRAFLSQEAADSLRAFYGDDGEGLNGRTMHGQIVNRERGQILVAVPWERVNDAGRSIVLKQGATLVSRDVLEIQEKQLDRPKTAVLAGAGVVAAAGVVLHILGGVVGGSTDAPGDGRGTERVSFPLLPLPW